MQEKRAHKVYKTEYKLVSERLEKEEETSVAGGLYRGSQLYFTT